MDAFLLDLRYAVRAVFRRPAFSAVAILTLAVGIGVNAVAFSAVSALLFKRLAFAHVERLAWVMTASRDNPHGQTTWTDFLDLRRVRSFEAVAAETRVPVAWQVDGHTRQAWGLLVTTNYFSVLGAHAEQGRVLGPADNGAAVGVVVSRRFWRTQLGGGVFGQRTLTINGQPCAVAGIMPDAFQGPGGLYEPDAWLPMEHARELVLSDALLQRDEPALTVIARLRESVTPVQALAEMAGISQSTATRAPGEGQRGFALYPMKDGHPEVRGLTPFVWLAMSIVAVVLLIACFNVASLLLARAAERRAEIGMRAALGASRWRITRQLLTEGAVLSAASGAAALVLAAWSGRLLAAFSLPSPIPQRLHMGLDAPVIVFTLAMVVLATILPSLVPAWHAARGGATRIHAWRAAPGRASRTAFVVAQIAGSTIFLAAALLFVRSFWNVASADAGFDTQHTVVAEVSPFLHGYDARRTERLAAAAIDRMAALPGARAVSVGDRVPFFVGYLQAEAYSLTEDCSVARCPSAAVYRIGPGYFAALGVPLREGRDLSRDDGPSRAVVSAHLAARLWPGRSALGRILRVGRRGEPVEIVGVAADVKLRSPTERPAAVVYRQWRGEDARDGLSLVVRTSGEARAMLGPVRDVLASIDASLPTQTLQTMTERMALPLWPSRTLAGFFAVCGTLSLVLATVGLFGVTYYVVQQRTREFGVRVALGATSARVIRSVLADGARVALAGTLLGSAGALASGRLASRALVDVSPADPLTFVATAALQMAIALAACAVPAWRASRTDPIVALRTE